MKRFRFLNVILLALIALAGWRTVDVWRRQAPVVDAGGDARPVEGMPPVGRKPAVPQVVNEIAQQDLFDASRKEGESEDTPTPEATPPPPPTLKLSGVLFVGLEPEAVLTDSAQGNKQIRLRVGEEISGYTVDRISAETISLVTGTGDEVVLSLLIDTTKRAKGSYGPGGRPTPKAAGAQRASGQRARRGGAVQAAQPGQAATATRQQPGSFAPNQDAKSEAERRREDARRRAERARERLKRLRAEAAKNR